MSMSASIKLNLANIESLGSEFNVTIHIKNGQIISTNIVAEPPLDNPPIQPEITCQFEDNLVLMPICKPGSQIIDWDMYKEKQELISKNIMHPIVPQIRNIYNFKFYKIMFKIYKFQGHNINMLHYVGLNGQLVGPNSPITCIYHDGHTAIHDWDSHVKPKIVIPWLVRNKTELLSIDPYKRFESHLREAYDTHNLRSLIFGYHTDPVLLLFESLIVWFNFDPVAINKHLDYIWHKWFDNQDFANVPL